MRKQTGIEKLIKISLNNLTLSDDELVRRAAKIPLSELKMIYSDRMAENLHEEFRIGNLVH